MDRGKFITVEGGEGVGKSTNIELVCELVRRNGHAVLQTREPGGTPMAERIRTMLLEHGDEALPDDAELLLFFAARSLHINNVIRPALEAGTWVVCDRFTDTTRAYQGGGRGLDRARIETLAEWVHGDLQPDLTVLLDAPPDVGRGRAEKRGDADRLETERAEFHGRVREAYLRQAAAEPQRFAVVDAGQPLSRVRADIEQAMRRILS
ncbi:MAG TPA: dTMP kinase [Woeseiaceae bacterium]|nr:dTMP kinase [Woeseiaceae bacterium]